MFKSGVFIFHRPMEVNGENCDGFDNVIEDGSNDGVDVGFRICMVVEMVCVEMISIMDDKVAQPWLMEG